MKRAALITLALMSGCSLPPSKDRVLAQCKVSGEALYAARPNDEIAQESHLTNCMLASGYSLVEAKAGQKARTNTERLCFASWDQAHWIADCYVSRGIFQDFGQ